MSEEKDDQPIIVAHNPVSFSDERKLIGEWGGIKFMADPNLPDDEIRVVQGGKVVARFKFL